MLFATIIVALRMIKERRYLNMLDKLCDVGRFGIIPRIWSLNTCLIYHHGFAKNNTGMPCRGGNRPEEQFTGVPQDV